MLDFRMNTFLTVCRCMNFTRASEELHITQPAVSQHIRYLEQYYGQKLFCYKGKRLGLTDAGEMLRNASLTMLQDEKSLQSRMQKRTNMPEELQLGVTSALGDEWLTEALRQYLLKDIGTEKEKKQYLKVVTADTEELFHRLEKEEIEFALTDGMFSTEEYEFCPYIDERMLAVCSPDYIFSEKPKKLESLLKERVFVREEKEGTRRALEESFRLANLEIEDFDKVVEIGSLHTMKELTKAGCGITFLYEAAVWKELNCGQLKEIKLKDFQVSRKFMFVWKKGNRAAGRYRELFAQYRKY